jgi:hypothetical protein
MARRRDEPQQPRGDVESRYHGHATYRSRRAGDTHDNPTGATVRVSILATIAEDPARFARQFLDWWPLHSQPFEEWPEALERFEVATWGAKLYPAAHGVLAAAVRDERGE